MISVKLIGDWNKAEFLLATLGPNLSKVGIFAQKKIATIYIDLVKQHLQNQDIPGWTPLSKDYAKRKNKKYGHEELLMASMTFYQSIKIWKEEDKYFAGIPSNLNYPNGKSVARIASIHEDWSYLPGKPHRPLWGYTFEMDLGGFRGVRKEVNHIIKTKLAEKGYPIKNLSFF